MARSENTLIITLGLLILLFESGNSLMDQCFNAEEMTVPQVGLSESQFWSAKAQDLEQCAKLCVRRKPCLSITYDTQSGMCELNAGTRADTPVKTGATIVYSEFQWWPSSVQMGISGSRVTVSAGPRLKPRFPPKQLPSSRIFPSAPTTSLDKNCYSRPCQDFESCISGSLADGSPDCSYSCITAARDVCPLPTNGVSNGRTVGSVNVYKCGKGDVGESATCLPSKQWDKEPTCTQIFDYQCSDNTVCFLINGYCSAEGKCWCGLYKTYDETKKECVHSCDDPPVVAGATLSGDGEVQQYTCDDGLYPVPGTGNGTITCDGPTSSWIPAFQCGGIRLTPGPLPEMAIMQHTGYLEMFADGEWRGIVEDWTWQATKVACRKLFGLDFGGTFHDKWFDTDNPTRLSKTSKLDNIDCTGDEEALEQCTYELKNGNANKELALTCFEYDVTSTESVKLYNTDGMTVLVMIAGNYGGVCGSGWSDDATEVACRTLNPDWTRDDECKNNCGSAFPGGIHTNHIHCNGDEPHLFYCENRGWGYNADCDPGDLVTIQCDTTGSG